MNNIVYRTVDGGAMEQGGRYNIWLNNIFVDVESYQLQWNTLRSPRGPQGMPNAYKSIYDKNIFYYRDPKSRLINAVSWTFDTNEKSDYNLFFCAEGSDFSENTPVEVVRKILPKLNPPKLDRQKTAANLREIMENLKVKKYQIKTHQSPGNEGVNYGFWIEFQKPVP